MGMGNVGHPGASKLSGSLKQLAKVGFSRYLHSHGSIRMPVASKGRGRGGRASPSLFLSPPFLNNAPPSPSIRSPPVVPSGVICVALPPAIAVRPGRSCVHPLAAGRLATLVNQQVVVVVVTVVAEDDLDEVTGRKGEMRVVEMGRKIFVGNLHLISQSQRHKRRQR